MNPAAKPWIEIKRQFAPGSYRVYASVHRTPLRIWVRGYWLWGRPRA